ncbi:MAG: hypothetical protein ABI277_00985 [Burkholderiaceae bacterium]
MFLFGCINLRLVFLECMIETLVIIVVTVPLLASIVQASHRELIWFGVTRSVLGVPYAIAHACARSRCPGRT